MQNPLPINNYQVANYFVLKASLQRSFLDSLRKKYALEGVHVVSATIMKSYFLCSSDCVYFIDSLFVHL